MHEICTNNSFCVCVTYQFSNRSAALDIFAPTTPQRHGDKFKGLRKPLGPKNVEGKPQSLSSHMSHLMSCLDLVAEICVV